MIDLFVNFIVFFNVIMREILIYYEEEFNYNWLIGVGIFLIKKQFFFIFKGWFVVVDGRSKYLKDENKSIDGKCYIK